MDNFVIHTAPWRRRFPSGLAVDTVGYMGAKRVAVDHAFSSCNVSFILSGSGTYRVDGRAVEVRAPCVLTQWPGRHEAYGPDGTWEELFVIYPSALLPELKRRRLVSQDLRWWPVRDPGPLLRQWDVLQELLQERGERPADRLDRVCELMILESRLGELRPPRDRQEEAVRALRERMRRHLREEVDLDRFARTYGLSTATLRRAWKKAVPQPPGRYLTQLRMREACRLLVETGAAVGEIAADLGYDDPLYFSRLFAQTVGLSARAYRRTKAPLLPPFA